MNDFAPPTRPRIPAAVRLALGLLALALAALPDAARAEEKVQLAPLLLKTYNAKGTKAGYATITIQIRVADAKTGKYVCAYWPRLREAVLKDAARNPLVQKRDGKVDLTGLDARFLKALRKVIKGNILQKVHVIDGSRRISKWATGSAAKLPSSSSGCARSTN